MMPCLQVSKKINWSHSVRSTERKEVFLTKENSATSWDSMGMQ